MTRFSRAWNAAGQMFSGKGATMGSVCGTQEFTVQTLSGVWFLRFLWQSFLGQSRA